MSDIIKPCPFCGNYAEAGHTGVWWVRCADPDCGADGPTRPTEAECIAAWNATPRTTAPASNTVRVRVAVSVSKNGMWRAFGAEGYADKEMVAELDYFHTDRLVWLVRDIPLPEPAAEIEAETEP